MDNFFLGFEEIFLKDEYGRKRLECENVHNGKTALFKQCCFTSVWSLVLNVGTF